MTDPVDGYPSSAHAAPGVRVAVIRLKKRADFLAAAKGRRQHMGNFVLQAREREPSPDTADAARVGFTVTKKVGKAVVRNRIRRRLREAVRLTGAGLFKPGRDYVLAARREALTAPFDDLRGELVRALKKIHGAGERRPSAVRTAARKQDL